MDLTIKTKNQNNEREIFVYIYIECPDPEGCLSANINYFSIYIWFMSDGNDLTVNTVISSNWSQIWYYKLQIFVIQ